MSAVLCNFHSIQYANQRYHDGNLLQQYINDNEICFKSFQIFLLGWITPLNTIIAFQDKKLRVAEDEKIVSCKLPILQKLGKYPSILIKKNIASYAGVYYGEWLEAKRLNKVLKLVKKHHKGGGSY